MNPQVILATIATSAVIILFLVFSNTRKAEYYPEQFMNGLIENNDQKVKEALSENLAKRFDVPKVKAWFQERELTPARFNFVDIHTFKRKAHMHMQSPNGLLRFDLVNGGGSKIANFCQADARVKLYGRVWMRHIQRGNFQKAYQYTVDAAYPHRQGVNFSIERLRGMYEQIKGVSTKPKSGQTRLESYYKYIQDVQVGEQNWRIEMHHRGYNKKGCTFMMMDAKRL